jgi:hypothetical protein
MIHAFVGIISKRGSNQCMRGNGKTGSMTGYLYLSYLEGKTIFTNYYTDFSEMIASCQDIIQYIEDNKPPNVYCGFTEMHNVINSIGSKTKEVLFINKFCSQIRKFDVEAMYDTQRFYDMNNRLREHTDIIWIPEKRHKDDLSLCNNDRCKKDHDVYVYRYEPTCNEWIRRFDMSIIGKHYDTKQIVYDTLNLDKKEDEKNGNK